MLSPHARSGARRNVMLRRSGMSPNVLGFRAERGPRNEFHVKFAPRHNQTLFLKHRAPARASIFGLESRREIGVKHRING
jgi:hypothetical protein